MLDVTAEVRPSVAAGRGAWGLPYGHDRDGRSTTSVGLSITETGAVGRALRMVDGLNLDGGGSTTMAVNSQVTNQPSDATGERPVGDALLVLPR